VRKVQKRRANRLLGGVTGFRNRDHFIFAGGSIRSAPCGVGRRTAVFKVFRQSATFLTITHPPRGPSRKLPLSLPSYSEFSCCNELKLDPEETSSGRPFPGKRPEIILKGRKLYVHTQFSVLTGLLVMKENGKGRAVGELGDPRDGTTRKKKTQIEINKKNNTNPPPTLPQKTRNTQCQTSAQATESRHRAKLRAKRTPSQESLPADDWGGRSQRGWGERGGPSGRSRAQLS